MQDDYLTIPEASRLYRIIDKLGEKKVAELLGVDRRTLARLLARLPVKPKVARDARSHIAKARA